MVGLRLSEDIDTAEISSHLEPVDVHDGQDLSHFNVGRGGFSRREPQTKTRAAD